MASRTNWWRDLKEKYGGIDGILLFVSISVFSTSLFYFFEDDEPGTTQVATEITTVGQFTSSRNDVRRRTQTGFTWSTVQSKDPVYEGDSIFTGEESEAVILMQGGSRLQLDPKSLVVVNTQGKNLQLALKYGSLTGKVSGKSPMLVDQNGKIQELSATDADIRIEASADAKETKIQVIRGQLSMKPVARSVRKQNSKFRSAPAPAIETQPSTSSHLAQTVKQNEIVQIRPDKAPVIRQIAIELLSPENGRALWIAPGEGLVFRWKSSYTGAPSKRSRIELARDANFTEIIHASESNESHHRLLEDKRLGGTFHWRVRPLSDTTKQVQTLETKTFASASSSVTVYPDTPPLPSFPADRQEFALNSTNGETGKQLTLSWEDDAGSVEFELQVAKDELFTMPILSKKLKSINERTAALGPGKYFWRVKGLHAQRENPPWSRAMSFVIEQQATQPPAPVLVRNEIAYEIPHAVLSKAPATVSISGQGVAPESLEMFRWLKEPSAQSFEVEVAESETFLNSIKHSVGDTPSFAPQEVKPGILYFRVRAKGQKGLVSEPSATGQLIVTLPAPRLTPIKKETSVFKSQQELDLAKHTFQLKWEPLAFAETYELEWGSDEDFSKSKKFRLKSLERRMTVSRAMDYRARVRALGRDGTPLSAYSSPETASYRKELMTTTAPLAMKPQTPKPPDMSQALATPTRKTANIDQQGKAIRLSTPILREPVRNTSFVSLEDSVSFVTLKWRAVPTANQYDVQIAEDADFLNLIHTFQTHTHSFTVQKPLPEGRVFWRVRAQNSNAQSEWSQVFDLNVLYQ